MPDGTGARVDFDFHGGATTRPLHARIRLIHGSLGEREEHFSVRAIEHPNPRAFQARLKAAMTESGIDKSLSFRHLAVIRKSPLPNGTETIRLANNFKASGGIFVTPTDSELRALWALGRMKQDKDSLFEAWLRIRRPASGLKMMRTVAEPVCKMECDSVAETVPSRQNFKPPAAKSSSDTGFTTEARQPQDLVAAPNQGRDVRTPHAANGDPSATELGKTVSECAVIASVPIVPSPEPETPKSRPNDRTGGSRADESVVPVGWRTFAGKPPEPVLMLVKRLESHTAVLAGSGSGKTVLLRRLIEEVALLGIPSIVLDCANDLATLGDRWPTSPPGWFPGDSERAKAYFAKTQTILWTPGMEGGNPLSLEPMPDLAAVADSVDELNSAVAMTCESLSKIVAPGSGQTVPLKKAILDSALRYFAIKCSGKLADFASLLAELPPDAGPGVKRQEKLATDMADLLKAAMQTDPLLHSAGTALDPRVLFGDDRLNGDVRLSVINFIGLRSLGSQQQFINQLSMILFAWLKRNPTPRNRPLRRAARN